MPWQHPLAADRRVLKALAAAEGSHATGCRVRLGA
jgi:hypothetical protein